MTSPARATGILGIGTIGALVSATVLAKVLALVVGPTGVGFHGVLQSILGLASIVFGVGVGTGVIRSTARALTLGSDAAVATVRRAGLLIAVLGGAAGALVFIAAREPLAVAVFRDRDYSWTMVALAPAVFLQLHAAVELGFLSGHQRVRAVAVATTLAALGAAVAVIAGVALGGLYGLPAGVLAGVATSAAITTIIRRRSLGPAVQDSSSSGLAKAIRELLRFGGGYTLSQLVGTGAQMLVPAIVIVLLSLDSVGYVRAAAAVAVGYLSVILVAMARDYFPRAVAASDDVSALSRLVTDQTRLVLAWCAPLILFTSAVAPVVISTLYSDDFAPAVTILQWMLIGDVLKLLSWTGSFVILARGGPMRYFLLESIGGGFLVVSTVIAVKVMGVEGVGVAYAATYGVYLIAVWVVARPIVRMAVSRDVLAGIGLALALAAFQSLRSLLPPTAAASMLIGSAAIALTVAWRVAGPSRSNKSSPASGA